MHWLNYKKIHAFRYHLYLICRRGFRSGHTKTSLLSYKEWIELEQNDIRDWGQSSFDRLLSNKQTIKALADPTA